jgi:DNA adenine methylase
MTNRGEALRETVPFLKWAGGKRQILPDILRRLPERCETYHEPFLGGGAVFFALAARGAFRRAVLGDRNADLIDAYLGVRDDVERVITRLARMPHDRSFYERLRALDPRKLSGAQRAARIIYLNRTCYNGLYRVNRAGQFNVPFGRYENPRILDRENLRAASRALRGAALGAGDFEAVLARARPGDVVYFDPPYVPLSATASFTAYDREAFGPDEQRRLARVLEALRRRGVYAVLSNSDVRVTRALYRHQLARRPARTDLGAARPDASRLRRTSLSRRAEESPAGLAAGAAYKKPPGLAGRLRPRPDRALPTDDSHTGRSPPWAAGGCPTRRRIPPRRPRPRAPREAPAPA